MGVCVCVSGVQFAARVFDVQSNLVNASNNNITTVGTETTIRYAWAGKYEVFMIIQRIKMVTMWCYLWMGNRKTNAYFKWMHVASLVSFENVLECTYLTGYWTAANISCFWVKTTKTCKKHTDTHTNMEAALLKDHKQTDLCLDQRIDTAFDVMGSIAC